MDLRSGRQGRTRRGRPQLAEPGALRRGRGRAARRSASRRPSARLHRPARRRPGQRSAAAGPGGGTPGGAEVAKICAEPSSGAVLTTGSHRKPAGAPAAAIRVDQVGYPSGAAKLAEIMTKARPSGDLALGPGPGRVLHGGRLRGGPAEPRRLEQALRLGVGRPVLPGPGAGPVPGRHPGRRLGRLAVVRDRLRRPALRPAAGQRALLLRERAGRPRLHPHPAAQRPRPPQRRQRDDLPQPAGRRQRQLQGQPGQVRDRGADQRLRRLVRRRGLPALRRDHQLHRGGPAAGHRVVPRADGAGAGARSPGADFTGEAKFGLDFLQRMWHSAPGRCTTRSAPARRTTTTSRDHDIWRLPQADDTTTAPNPHYVYIRHPPVFRAGKPGAQHQPEPGRAASRRLRALLPGVPALRPGLRRQLPARGRDRVRPGGHALEGTAAHRAAVGLLPGDQLAGRHDAGRHRTGPRPSGSRPPGSLPAGLPVRSAATYLRDAACWASAWVHSKQALARHAEPLRRERAGGLRTRSWPWPASRSPAWPSPGPSCWATCAGRSRRGSRRPRRTRSASVSPGTSGTPPRTAPG